MTKLLIFDPPQCCSTGVCGPDVDPVLVQFAADLKWLEARGIAVERYNLSQQPEVFVQHQQVLQVIQKAGTSALPLIVRDDVVVSHTQYPSRDELARMVGVANGAASEAEERITDDLAEAMLLTVLPVQSPGPSKGCCSDGEDCC